MSSGLAFQMNGELLESYVTKMRDKKGGAALHEEGAQARLPVAVLSTALPSPSQIRQVGLVL